MNQNQKVCMHCDEIIRANAAVCVHCGNDVAYGLPIEQRRSNSRNVSLIPPTLLANAQRAADNLNTDMTEVARVYAEPFVKIVTSPSTLFLTLVSVLLIIIMIVLMCSIR